MRLIPETVALAALIVGGCSPWAGAQQPEGGEQSVTGPAGAIYVDDGGGKDGIPVLFLHSFAGDSSHWASQLSHLRHHRRALAIDLRGHGKSAAPRDRDYSVDAFVKDLEAVVDKLKLPRVVLVGHSLGGAVAIKYAGRHPDRVAGLVVVGAPGKVPEEQSKRILGSIEADYDATMKGYWEKLVAGAQPNVRTQLLAKMESVPKDDSLAIMRALFADDPLPSLDRYAGPKLIIYTTQGDNPNDLQNARPKVPHRAIEGTSHWPHLDKPGEFNQVLDEFLAGVKG
jgi:pimeloyl-ACP methyl ester carboxylesterase